MTDKSSASKSSPAIYPQPTGITSSISPLTYQEAIRAKHPKLLKVVLDTNIYISAIMFGGNPKNVLKLARTLEIKVFISPEILLEVSEKLHKKFKLTEEEVTKILRGISKITEIIQPKIKLDVVKEDPSDNKVLECAVAANTNYMVTGDKHLLKLKRFEDMKIITPANLLKIIKV